jgi:hypothetical protein
MSPQTNDSPDEWLNQTHDSSKRIALPNEWLLNLQVIRLTFSSVWTVAVKPVIRLNTLFCTFRSEIFNTSNLMMKPLAIGAKFTAEQNLTFNFTFWSGFDTRTVEEQSAPFRTKTRQIDTNLERRLSNQLLDRLDSNRSSDTRWNYVNWIDIPTIVSR